MFAGLQPAHLLAVLFLVAVLITVGVLIALATIRMVRKSHSKKTTDKDQP